MRTLQYVAVMEGGDIPGFGVWFPDLPGCVSAGETEAEARDGAAEALSLHLEGMMEDGEALPAPSSTSSFDPDEVGAGFMYFFLVAAKVPDAPEPGYSRVTVTLPTPLWEKIIRAAGGNRSGWLAVAAKEKLLKETADKGRRSGQTRWI